MTFTRTEIAAVLAGLRLLQLHADALPVEIDRVFTDDGEIEPPLDDDEIDALCERINAGEDAGFRHPPTSPEGLLQEFVGVFGPAFDNDEDVNGGDTVEWIGEFLPRVRESLAAAATAEGA